jgi:DNA-binding NarL/FixJ family response regulator
MCERYRGSVVVMPEQDVIRGAETSIVIIESLKRENFESVFFDMSKRELEVYGYLPKGWTNVEIGLALIISDQTVKIHKTRIFEKLGVGGVDEAVLKGVSTKYFKLEALIEGLDLEKVKTLSKRERELLDVFSDIKNPPSGNKGAARRLHVATKTVNNHITKILDKLGVKHKIQATLLYMAAKEKGLLVEESIISLDNTH